MSAVLTWCARQDVYSKGESPTTRAVRRATAEDVLTLLTLTEQEYLAFRLHHANAHTVDSPEGFARRFRAWVEAALVSERFTDLARETGTGEVDDPGTSGSTGRERSLQANRGG